MVALKVKPVSSIRLFYRLNTFFDDEIHNIYVFHRSFI